VPALPCIVVVVADVALLPPCVVALAPVAPVFAVMFVPDCAAAALLAIGLEPAPTPACPPVVVEVEVLFCVAGVLGGGFEPSVWVHCGPRPFCPPRTGSGWSMSALTAGCFLKMIEEVGPYLLGLATALHCRD
jgi:hypothetical protein